MIGFRDDETHRVTNGKIYFNYNHPINKGMMYMDGTNAEEFDKAMRMKYKDSQEQIQSNEFIRPDLKIIEEGKHYISGTDSFESDFAAYIEIIDRDTFEQIIKRSQEIPPIKYKKFDIISKYYNMSEIELFVRRVFRKIKNFLLIKI